MDLKDIPEKELKFFYREGELSVFGWVVGVFAIGLFHWEPKNFEVNYPWIQAIPMGIGAGMLIVFGLYYSWQLLKAAYRLSCNLYILSSKTLERKKFRVLEEENAELKKQLAVYEPITNGSLRGVYSDKLPYTNDSYNDKEDKSPGFIKWNP